MEVFDSGSSVQDDGRGVIIDAVHHEIHEGEHYYTANYFSLAASGTADFCLIIPNDLAIHMVFSITTSETTTLEIYEDADFATDGTAITFFNSNRNSSNTTSLLAYQDSTINSLGNKIYGKKVMANSNARREEVGNFGEHEELVLKKGSKYIFRMTNLATGSNDINYLASYYEHR